MRTIVSTAMGCLVASVAFAALDADAANSKTALAAPSAAALVVGSDVGPIMVARGGADDPAGHNAGDQRRGRGKDDAATATRQGADDPAGLSAGDDRGRGRGKDDAVIMKRQGVDNPAGDQRRGRGRDDAANHA